MESGPGATQRGAPPGAEDQAFWPTPPESRRLPTAPRERKPALAALAALLILGGALGAGLLVVRSGRRVAAIEISRRVGAGQRIPRGAMREVRIAGAGLSYVAWRQAGQVARFYASVPLPAGTLLTSAMVARASDLAAGEDVLGLAVKDGRWPRRLRPGDHVSIYDVNGQGSCPGAPGAVLASDAIVLRITSPPPSSGSAATDVQVAVDPAAAGTVACNAADGGVALAIRPSRGGGAAAPRSSPEAGRPGASAATPSASPRAPGAPSASGAAPPGVGGG